MFRVVRLQRVIALSAVQEAAPHRRWATDVRVHRSAAPPDWMHRRAILRFEWKILLRLWEEECLVRGTPSMRERGGNAKKWRRFIGDGG
jgi:hypothetical protein